MIENEDSSMERKQPETQRDRGTRMSIQIDVDARRIANEIVFGDLNCANKLWKDRISDLKAFEAAALRDKIHRVVNELDSAKLSLEIQKDV